MGLSLVDRQGKHCESESEPTRFFCGGGVNNFWPTEPSGRSFMRGCVLSIRHGHFSFPPIIPRLLLFVCHMFCTLCTYLYRCKAYFFIHVYHGWDLYFVNTPQDVYKYRMLYVSIINFGVTWLVWLQFIRDTANRGRLFSGIAEVGVQWALQHVFIHICA